MQIGNSIRKLRELRNYTQQYMADRLELSISGYSKIERDETDISLSRLEKIAEVLNVEINTILSFDEKKVFNISHNQTPMVSMRDQYINQHEIIDKMIDQYKQEINYLKAIIDQLLLKSKS